MGSSNFLGRRTAMIHFSTGKEIRTAHLSASERWFRMCLHCRYLHITLADNGGRLLTGFLVQTDFANVTFLLLITADEMPYVKPIRG